jgi:hypothetical protein
MVNYEDSKLLVKSGHFRSKSDMNHTFATVEEVVPNITIAQTIDARTEDARKVVQLKHQSNSNTENISDMTKTFSVLRVGADTPTGDKIDKI